MLVTPSYSKPLRPFTIAFTIAITMAGSHYRELTRR